MERPPAGHQRGDGVPLALGLAPVTRHCSRPGPAAAAGGRLFAGDAQLAHRARLPAAGLLYDFRGFRGFWGF